MLAGLREDYRGWVAGVDRDGRVRWQRTPESRSSGFLDAAPASDGVLLAGATNVSEGPDERSPDPWLVRVAAGGDVEWSRTYQGTAAGGNANAVVPTATGHAVAGSLVVDGHDRAWATEVDDAGRVRWQWRAGDREGQANAVTTADGDVLVGGSDAPVGATGHGRAEDAWIVRLTGDGEPVWRRRFAGDVGDRVEALAPDGDGVVALGRRGFHSRAEGDGWLAALDAAGEPGWQRRYPRDGWNWLHDLAPVGDGYALVGTHELTAEDRRKAWLLRVGPDGRPAWERHVPDDGSRGYAVLPSGDGGLLVGGARSGEDGETAWLGKLGGDPADDPAGGIDLPSVPGWAVPFLGGLGIGAAAASWLRDRPESTSNSP